MVIGKLKDISEGIVITKIVGLNSKMCSYMKEDDTGNENAKRNF